MRVHLQDGDRMSRGYDSILKVWQATVKKSQGRAKKRANGLFPTMSVAPADDEPGPGQLYHAQRSHTNGEFYTGQWSDNLPHGHGKYVWSDGCSYVGEWNKGRFSGRGKFSWPSGPTFEGYFNAGFMHGKGTLTGSSNGDSYRGYWVMNLKDGQGIRNYANGDCYEGEWRKGLQNGQGKYQWRNGNSYMGQWRKGMINGKGTMIWSNGNRYDGYWEDGLPKGNGTFRWSEGSFYIGIWSKNSEEQSGTYYPSASEEENSKCDPQEVFLHYLNDSEICPDDKVSVYPSEKTLFWHGIEDQTYKKGYESDRSRNGFEGLRSFHSDHSADSKGNMTEPQLRRHPLKRQGVTIAKGHKNYPLMLNLQLGIRHSVGRPAPATSLDLKSSAFDPKEKLWTKFPTEGSKHTPPHQSCDFRWKDYCPVVFRTLRKLFRVDPADYMLSICGNDALRELSSPGKSGSFFYLTQDDRYMIKTLKKAEVKIFLRMLPAYYNHVRASENTLVTKFYGLHCVKLTGPAHKKVRFLIMGNLFCSEYPIHRRYDLKGSSLGRTTDKPDTEIDASTTLKDLDLSYIFRLQSNWFHEFRRQVHKDCDFLEQEKIMDYSLLVGIHIRGTSYRESQTPTGRSSGIEADSCLFAPARLGSIRVGTNMPAKAERTERRGDGEGELVSEPTGELYDIILICGIIDILQDYDISKKLEHAYKSFQYAGASISAIDPKQYSKRFRDFIFKVFVEDI